MGSMGTVPEISSLAASDKPQSRVPVILSQTEQPSPPPDDLSWFLNDFARQLGSPALVATLHLADMAIPERLCVLGLAEHDGMLATLMTRQAAKAGLFDRRQSPRSGTTGLPPLVTATEGDCNFIAIPITGDRYHRVVITLGYPAVHPPAPDRFAERLGHLHMLAVGLFRLWLSHRATRRLYNGLEWALNCTDFGLVILDRSANIAFANHPAQMLLDKQDGVRRSGSTMTAVALGDALKLQVVIDHVITGAPEERASSMTKRLPVVYVARPGRRLPLAVAALPVDAPPCGPADPAALLYIFDPDQDIAAMLQPACEFYTLSPAEARLAGLITTGATITEAAGRLRVTEQTARAYLKQVFLKTGTNRQAELVRLMLSSLVRARHQLQPRGRPT